MESSAAHTLHGWSLRPVLPGTSDRYRRSRVRGSGPDGRLAITDFVLGMPRSGSTLVEQILASHPRIHGAGELTALEKAAGAALKARDEPDPFPECSAPLDDFTLRRIGQAYLEGLPTLSDDKIRIVDKLPDSLNRRLAATVSAW